MDSPVDGLPNRLVDLLEHAVRASEPEVALHALSSLRRELDAFERVQAWRALDAGSSYGSVARALGISRQAAHRRYRALAAATEPPAGTSEPARLRVAPEARAAVQLAAEEAAALGAARMGSEHLLLGILRADDPIVSAALRAGGITIENARMAAQPTLAGEESMEERSSQVTTYARKVFTDALRAAAAEPGHVIGITDLFKSALSDPNGGACRTLEALSVDVDALRASL
jgi:transposase-like protein